MFSAGGALELESRVAAAKRLRLPVDDDPGVGGSCRQPIAAGGTLEPQDAVIVAAIEVQDETRSTGAQ